MKIHYWIGTGIVVAFLLIGGFLKWRNLAQIERAAAVWNAIESKCDEARAISVRINAMYMNSLDKSDMRDLDAIKKDMDAASEALTGALNSANERARRLYRENSVFASAVNDMLVRKYGKSYAIYTREHTRDELNYCSPDWRQELSRRFPTAKK